MVLLFLLFLMGCERPASPPSYELILDWFPNPNHIPLYVGIEKGYFREEGVEIVLRRSPEVVLGVTCVATGQTDFALTYMPTALKAELAGLPFTAAGILIDKPLSGLIFPKDLGIKKPQDLSGLKLGYSIDGTQETLETILKENGIVPQEKVNLHFDLTGMLLTRQVDFIYGAFWNIESEQLKSLGLEVDAFPLNTLGVPLYHELIVVTRHPLLAEKFQKALQKSIDEAKRDPDAAFEIYWQRQDKKSLATKQWQQEAWKKTLPLLAEKQTIDPLLWDEYRTWLEKNGLKGTL